MEPKFLILCLIDWQIKKKNENSKISNQINKHIKVMRLNMLFKKFE